MTDLAHELGIESGLSVAVVDDGRDLFRSITLQSPSDVFLSRGIPGSAVNILIVRLSVKPDYEDLFNRLKSLIKDDGALWIVLSREEEELSAEDLIREALNRGLINDRELILSNGESAIRYTIRN